MLLRSSWGTLPCIEMAQGRENVKGPHGRTTRFRACDRMLPHTLWAGDKRGDCRRSSLLASVPVRLTVSAVLRRGGVWHALLRAVKEHVHSHAQTGTSTGARQARADRVHGGQKMFAAAANKRGKILLRRHHDGPVRQCRLVIALTRLAPLPRITFSWPRSLVSR